MKLFELDQYTTGTNLILGLVALSLVAVGLTCAQSSCGKKHDTNALVAGAHADELAKELAEFKQRLLKKDSEIVSLKAQGQAILAKYEAAKKKLQVLPLPAPVTESGLTESLKVVGFRNDVAVQIGVPSVLNTVDATLVFVLDQQAKRSVQLDATLLACDGALKASEAVQKAQEDGLKLSGDALRQSQAEAQARATQVQELGKAMKIEKAKGWQKYAWGVAGVALTMLVKK